MMKHEESVRRMIEAIQRRDADAYAQLYAEDAVMHHPLSPLPIEGRAAIRESEQALFDAFSNIEIQLLMLLGSEERAAVEVVIHATNSGPLEVGPGEVLRATHRQIELPAVWLLEFNPEGLIRVERDYFDTAAFTSQLGL
jgi:steroid delta-isomerase-like uncharacterized protein